MAIGRDERITSSEIIRAEPFASALQPRIVGRTGMIEGPAWRLVHLARGEAEVVAEDKGYPLRGPAMALHPWTAKCRLRIAAGAAGTHLLFGPTPLLNAVGHGPEAADLRYLSERRVQLPLDGEAETDRLVASAFAAIVAETESGRAASRAVIESYLRILLVHLWRGEGGPEAAATAGAPAQRILNRFTSLVELHYRDRWTVARYARALGLSRDRLNDICRRQRGRTPHEIILSRTGVEARLLLEHSNHSLDQIAALLGFPTAAHFNRFFRTIAGIPPGRFRKRILAAGSQAAQVERPSTLYEWP